MFRLFSKVRRLSRIPGPHLRSTASDLAVLPCVAIFMLASASLPVWAQSTTAGPQQRAGKIVILGDSISAEYGIARGRGWVALLEQKLRQQNLPFAVVNASISGDTTAGGRTRLPALLRGQQPQIVVIELGGNDALRGLSLKMTQDNLAAMTEAAQKSGAKVLLAGMQIPPNYGPDYSRNFAQVYPEVAKKYKTALVPFLLSGIAEPAKSTKGAAGPGTDYFQADRIHPNEAAQAIIMQTAWQHLQPLLLPAQSAAKRKP